MKYTYYCVNLHINQTKETKETKGTDLFLQPVVAQT